ncbi:MAG: hypothetical protein AAF467_27875 [Actinomycetota bacterium]
MATRHHPHPNTPATTPTTERPTNHTTTHHRPATELVEIHPWGAPLPPGHPAYRPPRSALAKAFARWVTYVAILAVAFAIAAVAVLTITQPEPSTGSVELRSEPVQLDDGGGR